MGSELCPSPVTLTVMGGDDGGATDGKSLGPEVPWRTATHQSEKSYYEPYANMK